MTRYRLATTLVLAGSALIIIGIAAFSPVLALITAGAALAAFGLLALDVDRKVPR